MLSFLFLLECQSIGLGLSIGIYYLQMTRSQGQINVNTSVHCTVGLQQAVVINTFTYNHAILLCSVKKQAKKETLFK